MIKFVNEVVIFLPHISHIYFSYYVYYTYIVLFVYVYFSRRVEGNKKRDRDRCKKMCCYEKETIYLRIYFGIKYKNFNEVIRLI